MKAFAKGFVEGFVAGSVVALPICGIFLIVLAIIRMVSQ